MAETIAVLLIGSLAGSQITETIHHGSIFRSLRKRAASWVSEERWILGFFGELLTCPFCLSHWACALAIVWLWYVPWELQWPIYALAATRTAQAFNDAIHPITRSPSGADEEIEEIVDEAASHEE